MYSESLEDACDGLALADAHRRDPVARGAAIELVQQRRGDARTGRPEGMAERDSATVRVDVAQLPPLVEARVCQELEDDGCEGFVDLDHGDVVPGQPGLLERPCAGLGVPVKHSVRVDPRQAERDEARTWLQAVSLQ